MPRQLERYPGELGQRIKPGSRHKDNKTIGRRLDQLFDHYGIIPPCGFGDEYSWKALAIALARAHVPGLQVEGRRGRPPGPKKWTPSREARLLADVSLLVLNDMTESAACRHLSKKEPYKSAFGVKHNTLLRRFKTVQASPRIKRLLQQVPRTRHGELFSLMQKRYGDFSA